MEQFLDQYGYVALWLGTFFEGETAILIASSLTHTGIFQMPGTIVVGFAGSFMSDWLYYLVGRLNGKYFIERRPKLNAMAEPIRKFFLQHKVQLLISYRFLYGFRIIIPLVIGMSGVKPLQYLGYSLLSGLIWASVVSLTGYWLGNVFNINAQSFEQNILFVVLGFAAFGILVGYAVKKLAMKEMHVDTPE